MEVFGCFRFPPGSIDSVRPHLMTFVEATREQTAVSHMTLQRI